MASLSITDLFTPADSGVDPSNPEAAPAPGTWLATLYYIATHVGLSTTAWQSGGMVKSILALTAIGLNAADQVLSTDLQGGFLQWAAGVTPDPATVPASEWTPGWLDLLADGVYDVQRVPATQAPVNMTIANASATTYPTFGPGAYHVGNANGFTYSNVNALTIAPGSVTGEAFKADLAGAASSSAPSTITQPVTALVGVTVTNPASAVGSNAQTNTSLVQACLDSLATKSPNGPADAYRYFATQAADILGALTPSVTLRNGPITDALVQTNTDSGTVLVTIANAAGLTNGVANLKITGATNASPVVLSVSSISGAGGSLLPGDWCYVSGVEGNTGANGWYQAGTVTDTTVQLVGSVGTGVYSSGGALEGGDIGAVDFVIQSRAVGNADTEQTVWANSQSTSFGVGIWVPAAQVASVAAIAQAAVVAYVASAPVEGFVTGVVTPNTIPLEGVLSATAAALALANIQVRNQVGAFVGGILTPIGDLEVNTGAKVKLTSVVVNVVGV